jgi:hypothetical protein
MSCYYFAKGGNVVSAVHHDQAEVKDRSVYGTGTYVIVDLTGDFPSYDPDLPGYDYPTITPQIQSDSVKNEAQYRILQKINAQAQASISGYAADLANIVALGGTLTPEQEADIGLVQGIHGWITRPSGMMAASDSLIAANDQQWWLDGKWPAWDSSWDALVARFTL